MNKLGILVAVMLALAGQAPAAPVRHLVYAFATYPTAKPSGDYFDGTLTIDVLGPAPDGGEVVQATDWWYYTLRSRQTRQCEIYPDGSVHWDEVPPYPSDAQRVLLPLLAADFFTPGVSGLTSWQQKFALSFAKGLFVTSASMQLSATPQGSRLNVDSHAVFQQLDRRQRKVVERSQIVYDRTLGMPVVVHDVRGPLPTESIYSQTSVDLQLVEDSAAGTNSAHLQRLGQVRFQVHGFPSDARQPADVFQNLGHSNVST
ncbi:MAG: hypothetical protein WCE97_13205 [Candidatus Cybelea sp.]